MSADDYKLPPECVPGAIFLQDFGEGHFATELWHVRGLVDHLAVCRMWIPGKAVWRYECKDPAYFHVFGKDGNIVWRKVPKTKGDAN